MTMRDGGYTGEVAEWGGVESGERPINWENTGTLPDSLVPQHSKLPSRTYGSCLSCHLSLNMVQLGRHYSGEKPLDQDKSQYAQ